MSIVRAVLRPMELLLLTVMVRAAPRRSLGGFSVCCSNVSANCDAFFRQCGQALRLIGTHDPGRLRRMHRYVRTIALSGRGVSYYEPRLRTVFLDVALVSQDALTVARTLVHESTHARLYWAGVRTYSRCPERHERVCVLQEADFVRRLPGSGSLVRQLEEQFARPWWDETSRRAHIKRFIERYNLPRWVERFLVRFGAR